MRLLSLSLVFVSACDPREPEADAQPPAHEAAKVSDPAPVSSPLSATTVRAQPLEITLAAIRRSGQQVEIEVALDRKLPATGSSRPVLHVGELIFRRSRRAQGQLDRLVFLLSSDELDTLTDGATLIVRDRGFSSEQMASPPKLDKSKVVVLP
jgi:hypothetical protein